MSLPCKVTPIWPATLQLGEGTLWHAASSRFFFVDIRGQAVHSWSPTTDVRQSWQMPEMVGWLVPCADGQGFIAGFQSGFVRLTLEPELKIERLGSPHPDQPGVRLNDAKADAGGRIWAGSMHHENPQQPLGQLACLHPDGRIEVVEQNIHIANGPAISPDGAVMLHTDSLLRSIYRYRLSADGQLSEKSLWKTFAPEDGEPDGMTFDAEGCVWVAFWGGSCLRRFNLAGDALQRIDMPASQITNVAFGGEDMDLMLVTSARVGLSDAQLAEQPLAGSAFVLRTGVRGVVPGVWG
ncbi:MAG: SMP-30/gluconolactonase/LRE family protein [Rhodoferax sp.]|uniref:SMP-30/gluconolactonase/LRE family protein n=1 Tax=Rhodoferax sp. TaxID=50421 RepID=UPI003264CE91